MAQNKEHRVHALTTTENIGEPSAEVAPEGNSTEFNAHREWMSGNRVRCVIHSGQDDASRAPVYVSVQDYDAYFPRDVEVVIPEEAYNVIANDAVYDHITRNERGDLVTKKIRRFQFSLLERIPAPRKAA